MFFLAFVTGGNPKLTQGTSVVQDLASCVVHLPKTIELFSVKTVKAGCNLAVEQLKKQSGLGGPGAGL